MGKLAPDVSLETYTINTKDSTHERYCADIQGLEFFGYAPC